MSKPVYKSKTAVFNLFAAMSSIIAMFNGVTPDNAAGGVMLVAVINMILRFVTTVPVSFFNTNS